MHRVLPHFAFLIACVAGAGAAAQGTSAADPFSEIPIARTEVTVQPPQIRMNGTPEYPTASRRKGECGTTHLVVWVTETGEPGPIQTIASSGSQEMDAAAVTYA